MPITTRQITADFHDFDGTPLAGVRIIIELIGLGNGDNGAVAPGQKNYISDSSGTAVFQLWENNNELSDTYYQITSFHPTTGQTIHRKEIFRVGNSDANLKYLINVAPAQIDPNQALLLQIAADRSAAETARDEANTILSQVTAIYAAINTPQVSDQAIEVAQGVARVVYLGPIEHNGYTITYSAGSAANISINGNLATINSATLGQQIITITGMVNGFTGSGSLTVNVSSVAQEYSLANVVVFSAVNSAYSVGAPLINTQTIDVVSGVSRVVYLGSLTHNGYPVTYSANGAPNITINGNLATINSSTQGQQIIAITGTANGVTGTGALTVNVSTASQEYTLANVLVA